MKLKTMNLVGIAAFYTEPKFLEDAKFNDNSHHTKRGVLIQQSLEPGVFHAYRISRSVHDSDNDLFLAPELEDSLITYRYHPWFINQIALGAQEQEERNDS